MGKRLFATTPEGILSGLRKIAPHVVVQVGWEEDPSFTWDGDGPDPAEEGYVAHDVTVSAQAIVDGRTAEGNAYLGGVYEKPRTRDPAIHGYFPQMADEAFSDLYRTISGTGPDSSRKHWDPRVPGFQDEGLLLELRNAIKFMNVSMKEISDLERREREQ